MFLARLKEIFKCFFLCVKILLTFYFFFMRFKQLSSLHIQFILKHSFPFQLVLFTICFSFSFFLHLSNQLNPKHLLLLDLSHFLHCMIIWKHNQPTRCLLFLLKIKIGSCFIALIEPKWPSFLWSWQTNLLRYLYHFLSYWLLKYLWFDYTLLIWLI